MKESSLTQARRLYPNASQHEIMQQNPDLYWDLLFGGDLNKIPKGDTAPKTNGATHVELVKIELPPKPKIEKVKIEKLPRVLVPKLKKAPEPPLKVRTMHPMFVRSANPKPPPTPVMRESIVGPATIIASEAPIISSEPARSVVRRTTGVPQRIDTKRKTTEQTILEAHRRRDFYSRNKTQLGQLESMMRDRRR